MKLLCKGVIEVWCLNPWVGCWVGNRGRRRAGQTTWGGAARSLGRMYGDCCKVGGSS